MLQSEQLSYRRACKSVCLSVRLSHAGIDSKLMTVGSRGFYHSVAHGLTETIFQTPVPRGTPLRGLRKWCSYKTANKMQIFDQEVAISRKR